VTHYVLAMTKSAQRVVGAVVLLATGIFSLPLSAAIFDGEASENWIAPVQLLVMAGIGAGLAVALPALAREGASTGRRAMTGMWWGLLAALVGVLLFWFLVNGLNGA
jgi:hypothetical protein